MSTTFRVRASEHRPLTLGDLQRAIPLPIAASGNLSPEAHINGLVLLFRPGVSTRAVEVDVGDTLVEISVFTLASGEDHVLAIDLLEAIAVHRGATIVESEDDEAVPLSDLRRRFGDAWAAGQLEFGVRTIANLVDERPGSLIALPGPNRKFLLGSRLMAELREGGPPASLGDRLVEAMRRTQWPPDSFVASTITVSGGVPAQSVPLAVLTGRVRTLLPDVQTIAVQDGRGGQLYVPIADVAELLAGHARYLDERHLLVEALDPAGWEAFLEQAAPLAVDIDQL